MNSGSHGGSPSVSGTVSEQNSNAVSEVSDEDEDADEDEDEDEDEGARSEGEEDEEDEADDEISEYLQKANDILSHVEKYRAEILKAADIIQRACLESDTAKISEISPKLLAAEQKVGYFFLTIFPRNLLILFQDENSYRTCHERN